MTKSEAHALVLKTQGGLGLTPLQYAKRVDDLRELKNSPAQIAKLIGVTTSAVEEFLKFFNGPDPAKALVQQGHVSLHQAAEYMRMFKEKAAEVMKADLERARVEQQKKDQAGRSGKSGDKASSTKTPKLTAKTSVSLSAAKQGKREQKQTAKGKSVPAMHPASATTPTPLMPRQAWPFSTGTKVGAQHVTFSAQDAKPDLSVPIPYGLPIDCLSRTFAR